MATFCYTIQDDKLTEFKSGFLKWCPVPLGNKGEPIMSEKEWIKEWGKQRFLSAYIKGKKKAAEETAVFLEGLIE